MPIVGAIPPAPTILLKSIVCLYQISHFAQKISTLLTNEISKLAQRGLVQNCRGWGYRPDNRHILLLGHLGVVYESKTSNSTKRLFQIWPNPHFKAKTIVFLPNLGYINFRHATQQNLLPKNKANQPIL
jgi:hypothetical protein